MLYIEQYKGNDKINQVPWTSLLSSETANQSCSLSPWPRFPGDESNGRYRINMADIETLIQMAIGLHNGSIKIVASPSAPITSSPLPSPPEEMEE